MNWCKNFIPLYYQGHHHCGNCRLWIANLKSYTNARPLPKGKGFCEGVS